MRRLLPDDQLRLKRMPNGYLQANKQTNRPSYTKRLALCLSDKPKRIV